MTAMRAIPKKSSILKPTIFFIFPMADKESTSPLQWVSLFLTAANLAFTGYLSFRSHEIDSKLKDLEAIKRTVEINRDSVVFDREFKFKIYDLAIAAIKSKDSTLQDAAYVTVNAMMPDTSFKSDLLGLFAKTKSVPPDIRKAATVAQFDITESKRQNPVYSPKDKIHIDIIYLDNVLGTKSTARKIFNALRSSDYYEFRTKPLAPERNDLPIYQIQHNVIRYDEDEKAKAEKLRDVVNEILPEGVEPFSIEATAEGKPTKQYISLFVVK